MKSHLDYLRLKGILGNISLGRSSEELQLMHSCFKVVQMFVSLSSCLLERKSRVHVNG